MWVFTHVACEMAGIARSVEVPPLEMNLARQRCPERALKAEEMQKADLVPCMAGNSGGLCSEEVRGQVSAAPT